MKKRWLSRALKTTMIILMIIVFLESTLYYWSITPYGFSWSLVLAAYNLLGVFTGNAQIDMSEALKLIFYNGGFVGILSALYTLSLVAAPICTMGAVLSVLMHPLGKVRGILHGSKEHPILILGEGEEKLDYVENLALTNKVRVMMGSELEDVKRLEYQAKGIVMVECFENMKPKNLLRVMKLEKMENILLCDDDALKNIYYMKLIAKSGKFRGSYAGNRRRIFISCGNTFLYDTIRNAYDELPHDGLEMTIINPRRSAVDRMFAGQPIYKANDAKHLDVHLGILGFGEFGQNTLLQGLNQAVLSADSLIRSDVFDRHMSQNLGLFLKNFHPDIVNQVEKKQVEIYPGNMVDCFCLRLPSVDRSFAVDGRMELYFWDIDFRTLAFSHLLGKTKEIMNYTYFVVAVNDMISTAASLEYMKQLFYEEYSALGEDGLKGGCPFPLLVRTKNGEDLDKYFAWKNLYILEQSREFYSYRALCDQKLERQAMRFNHRYNLVAGEIGKLLYNAGDEENRTTLTAEEMLKIERLLSEESKGLSAGTAEIMRSWMKMSSFDWESSMAQAMHQPVKRWLVKELACLSIEEREELERLEHRRWNIFHYTHGFKYAPGKKDMIRKTHPCLSNWEKLKEERPDTMEYDYTPYYML